jgi:hypothetical protein
MERCAECDNEGVGKCSICEQSVWVPRRRRRLYIGACPECGAAAVLHALSCRYYELGRADREHLSDACLEELRALPPSQWHGWPPDDYDRGCPSWRYGRTTSRRCSPKSTCGGTGRDPITCGRKC